MENKFISGFGISFSGAISKIRKSQDQLQPIYEAFTNSLEALKLLSNATDNGFISVKLFYKKNNLLGIREFDSITIEDSGIGFNEQEFDRLINLNDTGKGFHNKGSGRVQFLHYFDKTEFNSVFSDAKSKTGFKQRKFSLSKSEAFLKHNAIIKHESNEDIEVAEEPTTTVNFKTPLNEVDRKFYNELSVSDLKENLITRYLALFCERRESLPKITIEDSIDGKPKSKLEIKSSDIPRMDKQDKFKVYYSKLGNDGKGINKSDKFETLDLKCFKIPIEQLKRNGLKLTSKGEIAKDLKLESLLVGDHIEGNRYLFLVSGDYINDKDTDTRGNLNILTTDDFKKKLSEGAMFSEEEILLDDIREVANEKILTIYKEIKLRLKEKDKEVDKLKNMFLLNPEYIKEAKIKLNDTEEEILEKVYRVDARVTAKKDAEIKRRVDNLDSLNPNAKDFNEKFVEEVNELTQAIPLQNRTQLAHYVARRKLVLELFDKILDRKLNIQQTGKGNNVEALIHNLLFQKGSDKPENSDLWIINEDFIYFDGASETPLSKIKIKGKDVFKKKFSEEEERYIKSLGENRKLQRPDVLLFPDEGKCIILEFKAPDVNAADHLTQIDLYANLIRNYTEDKFQLTTFYGYLIGESIESRDVLGRVSSYEESYQFDYLFRPSTKVTGFDGRTHGSLYTEVIKYSTLIARAKRRNSIFIDKL